VNKPPFDVTLPQADIERALGEMPQSARRDAVLGLRPRELATLFESCADAPTRQLTDLVPAAVPPLFEIIHDGKSSLPAFNRFQKRFCRPPATDARELWGYNEQSMRAVTGPGYFVVYRQDASETGVDETVIDYRRLPPNKPDAWPPIRSNSARLSRFVYAGSVDVLRRVSAEVTIGRVYKSDKAIDVWFALVRPESWFVSV
jgi:hypothetical protein